MPEDWCQGDDPTINAPRYRIAVGGYLNTKNFFLNEHGRFRAVMKTRRGFRAEAAAPSLLVAQGLAREGVARGADGVLPQRRGASLSHGRAREQRGPPRLALEPLLRCGSVGGLQGMQKRGGLL